MIEFVLTETIFVQLREISEGITITDKDGRELGQSTAAAKYGIAAVAFSRVVMAAPGFGMEVNVFRIDLRVET